jgi:hypothetical protein
VRSPQTADEAPVSTLPHLNYLFIFCLPEQKEKARKEGGGHAPSPSVQLSLPKQTNNPNQNRNMSKAAMKADLRRIVETMKQTQAGLESRISKSTPAWCMLALPNYKYLVCAFTHMHNGNKKAYEKYKQKMRDTYSELLDAVMEEGTDGDAVQLGNFMKENYGNLSGYEDAADFYQLWK